jgi:citrate lyase subunit beta/citryl-CoA lyase
MTSPAAPPRPRRSALYLPASNARAIEKARGLDADVVILDLEDAVAPEAKAVARDAAVAAVAAGGFGRREVVIRVNGLDTPWGEDDLAAVAGSRAAAVLFPKVEDARSLREWIRGLDQAGGHGLPVWVMAELPQAVLAMDSIASLAPRVAVIVMGTADLARALRLPVDPARTGLLPALSACVVAARARGLDILDGIFADLRDEDGLRAACRQGRSLGFDGKTLIHPAQIAAANEAFGVSAAAAADAARVLAAWESAAAGGSAIAVLDGRMIERLHAEDARRALALHEAVQRGSTGRDEKA